MPHESGLWVLSKPLDFQPEIPVPLDLAFARTLASIFEASDRSKFDWTRKPAFRSTVFVPIASFRTVCLIFAHHCARRSTELKPTYNDIARRR
jgi:hypothetical protein